MKKQKLLLVGFLASLLIGLSSCDGDEPTPTPTEITFDSISLSIAENPADGQVIGTIPGSVNVGDLAFSLRDQNPADAMAIDPNTGQLTVKNASLFDFEVNPTISATGVASVGNNEKTATITVMVTDLPNTEGTEPFITKWKTTTANELVEIGINPDFTYDYTIDWGDGSTDANQTAKATHTYVSAGTHTVKITGIYPAIRQESAQASKLMEIVAWGNLEWKSMNNAFLSCGSMTYSATDAPDLLQVTDMERMFAFCVAFDADLSDWDVSKVTNMSRTFQSAFEFNGNLNGWNVSNVTDMSGMFENASKFNRSISNWNVSKVTNMESMFKSAFVFNQDLNTWNVSSVENMKSLFEFANKFNGDISNWITSKATTMERMLTLTKAFDQDISDWNVSNVTSMEKMFQDSKFNQNINDWDVSNVGNMDRMFQNTSYNSDISDWDVDNVENMSGMFANNTAFNQDISNWEVGNVTNLEECFNGSTSFNQNLGGWDISKVSQMNLILANAGLSTNNYDLTLDGWSKLATAPSNISVSMANLTYCALGETARAKLINDKSWVITNDEKGSMAQCQ